MKFNAAGLLLCTFLVGCGGTAPFGEPEVEEVEEEVVEETIGSDRILPPGTASPQPGTTIFRKEALDDQGNGFATWSITPPMIRSASTTCPLMGAQIRPISAEPPSAVSGITQSTKRFSSFPMG
jgi:hypothetical protein